MAAHAGNRPGQRTRPQLGESETREHHMIETLDALAATGALPPELRAHLTSPVTHAALRIHNAIAAGSREYLGMHGFVELLPPIIGTVTDPGARGAKPLAVALSRHKYEQ